MTNHRTNEDLLAFLLGAVVGAGAALLLAPQSGEETRRRIGDTARRLGHDLDERTQGVRQELKHRAGDIKSAVNAGREAYERARHGDEPAPTSTAM
jgi:gas vesicle protein